jgi:hypothetical protein
MEIKPCWKSILWLFNIALENDPFLDDKTDDFPVAKR